MNATADARQLARLSLVERHIAHENAHDLPGLLETLTEDCVYEVVPTGQRWQGHDGARAFYQTFLGAFPDVTFELVDIVSSVSSLGAGVLVIRLWRPRKVWRFEGDPDLVASPIPWSCCGSP